MTATTVYRYVGMILLLDAVFMLLSCLVSALYGFDAGMAPLFLSFLITSVVGCFPMVFVPKKKTISVKEGYLIVICAWLCSCIFGMLPYILWGGEFSFANAFFESTSGFTTNGATILGDIESLPESILFWRSSTQWIGGVGVVLFALVIVPSMGSSKNMLTSVEISSMAKDNFRFTSRNLFRVIISVYLALTVLPTLLLWLAGMDFFDAVNHGFTIAASGGFSTKNTSLMWWNSPLVELIAGVFLILTGTHLGLLYLTFTGRRNNMLRNDVWRFFICCIAVCGLIVSCNLYSNHLYATFGQCLRYGYFQVVSYITSAGFASVDNSFWPPASLLVLIIVSVGCSMAGSTSGGLKIDRIIMLLKAVRQRIIMMRHPNAVLSMKIGGKSQDTATVNAAMIMIGFYVLVLIVSTFVVTLYGYDLVTAFSTSVATLGNVGPGVGRVGSLCSMDFFPDALKWWLSMVMLFGRLELFGLINVFFISTWK